ncbi:MULTISPECIES: DMT family transporter [Anaeromyxobacter]|uniref:DMT family transporter n=1 Tax=Anaeromyxobacter TaxID=161492 RepID=UPI001F56060D|nr:MULTISPECIES: DMT family transporter [unclassified Anaeromyxobacter]
MATKRMARPHLLLALLVLAWAISWPVIKIGVTTVPPIWFGVLRYVLAASCLFGLVALRRELAVPPRSDWPLIAVSAVFQMGAYSALTGLALTVLPPGRASVLAFSTPIWVLPLSAWWLHERPARSGLLGVCAGLLGVVAIAAPSLRPAGSRQLLAYGMLMGAAAAWAISIVFVRRHRFTATALALAPWQALAAAILLLPIAALSEGALPPIGWGGAASLAYVGPVATAFGYWAVVEAGRHLRASTMSTALLAAPSLGILFSAVTLGEVIGPSLVAGVALIGAGIRLATTAAA